MTVPAPEFNRFRVEAALTELVTDEWVNMHRRSMTLNGETYRFAYMEEVPGDDPAIFIVRESDGLRLECEVWVSIYPSDPPDVRKTDEVPVKGEVL